MGEEDDNNKDFKQKHIDEHRKKYQKKKEEDMTEEEKRDEEEMRALNNGPTSDENRSCHDILCCLFFICFIAGCAVITGIGFSRGNPEALSYIYDEDGNPCGKSGKTAENYPYLYLYNAVKSISKLDTKFANQGICVKGCPTSYDNTTLDCLRTTGNSDCSVTKENIYLSEVWLQRLCVPNLALYQNEMKRANSSSTGRNSNNQTSSQISDDYQAIQDLINNKFINVDKLFSYIGDFVVTWPIMIACIGIALVVGFFYLLIIRCCGGCIAYIVIFLILGVLCVLGGLFNKRMYYYESLGDTTYYNIMLAFSIVFYGLAFIWLIIILCSCNKIRLAIAITEVSAIFVWKVMSILLVPVIMFIVVGLYLAYWIALSVFIYSAGDVKKSQSTFLATVDW